VQQALARRAYEIFESRGSASWHELEDWRQAESEVMRPRCSGQMTLDGNLWVGTDAASFEEGTIEIWVAPRQVTICGKARVAEESPASERNGPRPYREMIFHVLEPSAEIDPARVTAKFNGPSLEIFLRKAAAKPEAKLGVKAAAA